MKKYYLFILFFLFIAAFVTAAPLQEAGPEKVIISAELICSAEPVINYDILDNSPALILDNGISLNSLTENGKIIGDNICFNFQRVVESVTIYGFG